MKKTVVLLASILMAFSMVGCAGSTESSSDSSESSEESSIAATEAVTEDESSVEETEPETEAAEESSEEATEAEESQSENSGSADIDVSDAILDTDTSYENPAEIGQWVKTTRYSATDKTYHYIYVRVTKATSSTEDQQYVDDAIARNNEVSSDYGQINIEDLKIPSDAELCVLDYEVYVPEDFPTNEWGITTPDVSFTASNIGGGGIPSADGASTYIGMGTTMTLDTEEEEPDYQVGNVYTFRELYMMVKGYENYVFRYDSYVEGTTELSSDLSTNGYHKAF